MSDMKIGAIYKGGALKPSCQLPLKEGQKESITLHAARLARRRPGLIEKTEATYLNGATDRLRKERDNFELRIRSLDKLISSKKALLDRLQ